MRRSVLPHQVHHSGTGAARVVNVGKAVCQTRPQMQQRGRRVILHPVPAIGGARRDSFKKYQDASKTRVFERRQKVHFRRTRIGEAYFDALIYQCCD